MSSAAVQALGPPPAAGEGPGVEGPALRALMRRVPAPVAVVTAAGAGEARGMTVGSLVSASLDPPLVSFYVARDAQMRAVLAAASGFAAHLLGEGQSALAEAFAAPGRAGEEQLAGVAHRLLPDGTPLLSEAPLVLHCRMHARYPAGDHCLVVGEVVRLEEVADGGPLLYYERSYHGIGPRVR